MESNAPIKIVCSGTKCIQTTKAVINKFPESLLAKLLFKEEIMRSGDEILINCADRDPKLIRHIINCLRSPKQEFILPDDFTQHRELLEEVRYLNLSELVNQIKKKTPKNGTSTITVSYHGTITFGKQGMAADVNFRKIHRILVCGKMSDCKQVFGATLNQGRDGDMGEDRYTSRVYLKHTFLEQAFDALASAGYTLISATSHTPSPNLYNNRKDEQECYMHYSQYTFKKDW